MSVIYHSKLTFRGKDDKPVRKKPDAAQLTLAEQLFSSDEPSVKKLEPQAKPKIVKKGWQGVKHWLAPVSISFLSILGLKAIPLNNTPVVKKPPVTQQQKLPSYTGTADKYPGGLTGIKVTVDPKAFDFKNCFPN